MPKKKVTKPKPPCFRPMIRRGNLSEVKEWIESGKPLRMKSAHNSSYTQSMLEFATEVGFYSLVELLLALIDWEKEELGDALQQAASTGREDLISLLLENGAPWESVDADDIIATMDEGLIRRFLTLGMRFDTEDAFFCALERKRARPLLRLYKLFRPDYPELEDQIAKALAASLREKRLRWSILLLWAGADPNRPVPYEFHGAVDEDTFTTTALEEAYSHGDLEFLEQLKIESKVVDLGKLLDRIAYKRSSDLVARIVKRMKPDEFNTTERNSCRALEYLVGNEYYNFSSYSWMSTPREQEEKDILESITLLINSGARWNPPENELRGDRKGLSSYSGKYIVQVLRLLIYTPDIAPFEKIWELCRTPKMKNLIYVADDHLWREMNEKALQMDLKGATKRNSRNRASRKGS